MCRYGMRNLSSPRSQKPTASRMAIVASKVLPIIGVFPFQDRDGYRILPCASRVPGAGGKPESNGGPPEARLGCRGRRSMPRAVAVVEIKAGARRKNWRAEVGPRMRGARPRPVVWSRSSFEGLVLSEIGDRNTQGVDGDQFVGNFALKNEHEIRCV